MVASWETKGSIDDQRATFMSKLMIDKLTTENHLKGIKGVLIKGYVSKESRQMMPEPVEVELALACEDLVEAIKDILEKGGRGDVIVAWETETCQSWDVEGLKGNKAV